MASHPTRRLILLRHAKSAWPGDVADHERPLAPRGRRDAPAAGRWLRKAGLAPDLVLCSTARRARETWQLAEENLGADPETVFEQRVYGASSAELLDLARQTPADIGTLLIVGHDPAMQRAVLELAGPGPGRLRRRNSTGCGRSTPRPGSRSWSSPTVAAGRRSAQARPGWRISSRPGTSAANASG